MEWIDGIPKFDEECLFLTATEIDDEWEVKLWEAGIVETDDGWYIGLLEEDGEEWGDWSELYCDKYLVIPKIKNK